MPLADLDAGQCADADGSGRGREPVPAEHFDQGLGPRDWVLAGGGDGAGIPALEPLPAMARPGRPPLRPHGRTQTAPALPRS